MRAEAPGAPALTGSSLRQAIRAALAGGRGSQPDELGHVNAHGVGTIETDRVEAAAIAAELGTVPVTAPKSCFGHLGAGGGAVELAASVLGLAAGSCRRRSTTTPPTRRAP